MTLTPEDRARLRALAEAATPGPWETPGPDRGMGGVVNATVRGVVCQVASASGEAAMHDTRAETGDIMRANAAFMAATDPATVLALLDALDAAEREEAELNATFDLQHAADQRAVARWRDGHPERDLVLPDRADLVVWLMDALDGRTDAIAHMIAGGEMQGVTIERDTLAATLRTIALAAGLPEDARPDGVAAAVADLRAALGMATEFRLGDDDRVTVLPDGGWDHAFMGDHERPIPSTLPHALDRSVNMNADPARVATLRRALKVQP